MGILGRLNVLNTCDSTCQTAGTCTLKFSLKEPTRQLNDFLGGDKCLNVGETISCLGGAERVKKGVSRDEPPAAPPLSGVRAKVPKSPVPPSRASSSWGEGERETWVETSGKGDFHREGGSGGHAREPESRGSRRCSVRGASGTFPSHQTFCHFIFRARQPFPCMGIALVQMKMNFVFVRLLWQFS